MIREAFQDLNRLRQIAVIAGRYGFSNLLESSGLKKSVPDAKYEENHETRSQTVARRFRQASRG